MYFLFGGFCHSVILHSSLTHGNRLPSWIENFGIWLTTLSLIGPPLGYIALHRKHHAHADTKSDTHSPHFESLFQIFYGSYEHNLSPVFIREHLNNKWLFWVSKHYLTISFIHLFVLFLILNIKTFFILIILPSSLSYHAAKAVSFFCHIYGYRNYEVSDRSTNFWPLAILFFGEGWHNNHHADPKNVCFGKSKWEFDLGGSIHNLIKNRISLTKETSK